MVVVRHHNDLLFVRPRLIPHWPVVYILFSQNQVQNEIIQYPAMIVFTALSSFGVGMGICYSMLPLGSRKRLLNKRTTFLPASVEPHTLDRHPE